MDIDPHYTSLGLKRSDSKKVIKKRYKKLVTIWHPDKWINDSDKNQKISEERFKEIQISYEIIKKDKEL